MIYLDHAATTPIFSEVLEVMLPWFQPERVGNPGSIHTQGSNAHKANSFCYTGDLSNDQRLTVALLIRWHMWPYVVEKSDNPNKTARKVQRLLGENIWKQIMVLNDCDRHTH